MEIAERLTISHVTVCRDIKTLHQVWLKSSLVDYDEAKGKELAKVDKLEYEYWVAWERSCEDAETVRQEGIKKNEGDTKVIPDKIVKTAKGQAGDPRFLAGVQWCINKRCEILGLDAPEKRDIMSGGKSLFEIEEWKRVAEENAAQIAELEDG
jgi:hypothetical protein